MHRLKLLFVAFVLVVSAMIFLQDDLAISVYTPNPNPISYPRMNPGTYHRDATYGIVRKNRPRVIWKEVFDTVDTPSDVIEFYNQALPLKGWGTSVPSGLPARRDVQAFHRGYAMQVTAIQGTTNTTHVELVVLILDDNYRECSELCR